MEIGKIYHGFELKRSHRIEEIDAVLHEMRHVRTGAKLCWLDRKDENMTFGIGFKTIPEDSTGVFHILEHSVLCGSDKYPIKDPFVELLKSSVNTFLNALTFPDKTVYPFSSRNKKDFLNLMDVYLDATLHPNIYHNPAIFRQEGWRFEINDEGEAEYQGVVLNEMKGAYSDPDTVMQYALGELLFPDTPYRHESGGHPAKIPDLTYEQFIAMHRKYYHPTNSRTLLVGSVDIDACLEKINSFFEGYDRLDADFVIPFQKTIPQVTKRVEYEIGAEESPEGKAIITTGWLIGTYEEKEKDFAATILADYLAGDNEAPLKKAILEKGLGQDMSLSVDDGIIETGMHITVRNTDEDKADEIGRTIRETLENIAGSGLDIKRLRASYNRFAYRLRDKDNGPPRSLIEGLTILDSWLYGGDPALYLENEGVLEKLGNNLDTGYFENLIRTLMLDNPNRVNVILAPSTTLGAAKLAEEKARVKAISDTWDDAALAAKRAELGEVRAWQETPDSPENLARIPVLALSDIDPVPKDITPEIESLDGVTVLRHKTGSLLVNADLWFDASDLGADELYKLSLLSKLLSKLGAGEHSGAELQALVKSSIGRLNFDVSALTTKDGRAKIYLSASLGALVTEAQNAAKLLLEILTSTRFDDKAAVNNLMNQIYNEQKMFLIGRGNYYAFTAVGAFLSPAGRANEELNGASFIEKLKAAIDCGEDSLFDDLSALLRRIVCRERLVLGASEEAGGFTKAIIAGLPCGTKAPESASIQPLPAKPTGIAIPAPVAYAAKGVMNAAPFTGASFVLQNILTFGYLWGEVRVLGGAYGVGYAPSDTGASFFWSYRDPKPARSLGVYDKAGDFIRTFLAADPDITASIIAATKSFDPLLNVKTLMAAAENRYLSGKTHADISRVAGEVLAASKEDLLKLAEELDRCAAAQNVVVIGGKHLLETCEGLAIKDLA